MEDKKILAEIISKAHNALILSIGDEVLREGFRGIFCTSHLGEALIDLHEVSDKQTPLEEETLHSADEGRKRDKKPSRLI